VQRKVSQIFLEAYNASDAPLKTFILRSIKHHVTHAQQEDIPLHKDELIMRILNHNAGILVARAVSGIGEQRMQEIIDTCEADGEWLAAAQLWFAASALLGQVNPLNVVSDCLNPTRLSHSRMNGEDGTELHRSPVTSHHDSVSVTGSKRGQSSSGHGPPSITFKHNLSSHWHWRVACSPSSC